MYCLKYQRTYFIYLKIFLLKYQTNFVEDDKTPNAHFYTITSEYGSCASWYKSLCISEIVEIPSDVLLWEVIGIAHRMIYWINLRISSLELVAMNWEIYRSSSVCWTWTLCWAPKGDIIVAGTPKLVIISNTLNRQMFFLGFR